MILVPYMFFAGIILFYQLLKYIVFSGNKFNLVRGIVSIIIPISRQRTTNVYGLWFLP